MDTMIFGVVAILGLASFFDRGLRSTRNASAVCGIIPLVVAGMAAAKGLGSFFGSRAADKKAKAQAANQNAMNKWKGKFDTANWDVEKKSYYTGRDRSRSLRGQLQAAIMNNPKYGLDKLFPGFANYRTQVDQTANPYATAGPAPTMQAVEGGMGAAIGGGLAGAAEGAMQGVTMTKGM
jgi:hypothetical protein